MDTIDIIHEINQIFKEYKSGNVFIYPLCEISESDMIFTPKKINTDILNAFKHTKTIIEEFNYGDLVKIIENETKISYAIKYICGKMLGDSLLCCINYKEIDENKLPYAHIGIYKEIKNIELLNVPDLNLELTEFMLENNSFCIRIKEKPSSSIHKKELRKEIFNIYTFIQKLN